MEDDLPLWWTTPFVVLADDHHHHYAVARGLLPPWMVVSLVRLVRFVGSFISLTLPAVYISHRLPSEMIPVGWPSIAG